ncbi:AraC family transcriptional regulator [Paenibacillus sp. J5C_2022]|uniref:helix-turn-helix domain-containing protein n=1 Tax=Paenibacillus sp. J5C2022 TaxID=2977129 RepID=UPI0021D3E6F2|nr:AraC family transcriptional regulator [Paenibacillus sp. J5C2022]MCU6710647.1 AraC family transcriptional regulator [Paenibacillus sp. J5C2022]
MIKPGEVMRALNKLNFHIVLAGHKKQDPGWSNGPFTHRFHSLWLIAKGKGTFTLDGTAHAAESGKLFAIAPGMVIERRAEGDTPLEFFFIRFQHTLSYYEDGRWQAGDSRGSGDDAETPAFPLSGCYSIQNPLPILHHGEQLCGLIKRRGQIVLMRQRILFLDMLTHIVSDLRSQIVTGHTNTVIEKTIDYMVHHYHESISVEELAQMAGLSPSHYSRLFKKYTGYSPIHYLTQIRMDRAKELLVLSDYKLKAIAQSIGYSDELYFSRLFKKNVGSAPSQYAIQHKTAPKP